MRHSATLTGSSPVEPRLGQLPEPDGEFYSWRGQYRVQSKAGYSAETVLRLLAAERERWQRIAAAAQAVTEKAEDIGDFLVSSHLMSALSLALDEGPDVEGSR